MSIWLILSKGILFFFGVVFARMAINAFDYPFGGYVGHGIFFLFVSVISITFGAYI